MKRMHASVALLLTLLIADPALAQPAADAETAVRQADEAFWAAYNRCDLAAMGDFFTDDVEFYHDKGGLTKSRPAMIESLRKGICGDPNRHLRRAPAGKTEYYAMAGNRALLIGEHQFFIKEPGKPEYLDGQAKFDDLWELSNGHWRMSRVFSYAHGPASQQPAH